MSTGYGWEGLRQVCATLHGARHVPERLCSGIVYLGAITNVLLYLFLQTRVFYLIVEHLKRWTKVSASEHSVTEGTGASVLGTVNKPRLGVSSFSWCASQMTSQMTSLGAGARMTSSSSGGAVWDCLRSGRDGELGDESFESCASSTSPATSSLFRSTLHVTTVEVIAAAAGLPSSADVAAARSRSHRSPAVGSSTTTMGWRRGCSGRWTDERRFTASAFDRRRRSSVRMLMYKTNVTRHGTKNDTDAEYRT